MSTAKRLTPNKIANLVMADEAWHDSEYVAASDYDALSAELAALRDKALKFDLDQAGIARREADAAELIELRAELAALRAEVELWKERAYQLSHAFGRPPFQQRARAQEITDEQ